MTTIDNLISQTGAVNRSTNGNSCVVNTEIIATSMNTVTCILHAGVEKTGTTSLQRFLRLNKNVLAERKIWIPETLVWPPVTGPLNHTLLSTSSRLSPGQPDDLQTQLGLKSMAMVREHRVKTQIALQREFEELEYLPSIIIVSSEHIHSRLRNSVDLDLARSMLLPFCSKFRVIVYLREQSDLARSLAGTAVRNGATELRVLPDFSTSNGFDPVLGVDFDYFDYLSVTTRLERTFGSEAMVVRIYDPMGTRNFDLIDDFFVCSSIDIAGLQKPGRENVGFSDHHLKFLARLNRYLPAHGRGSEIRSRILAYMSLEDVGQTAVVPTNIGSQFMKQFEVVNEAVRLKWFPGIPRLFAYPSIDYDSCCGGAISEAEIYETFIDIVARAIELGGF